MMFFKIFKKILDMNPDDEPEEDGANVDLDDHRKGKCAVIKASTRQVRIQYIYNNQQYKLIINYLILNCFYFTNMYITFKDYIFTNDWFSRCRNIKTW